LYENWRGIGTVDEKDEKGFSFSGDYYALGPSRPEENSGYNAGLGNTAPRKIVAQENRVSGQIRKEERKNRELD